MLMLLSNKFIQNKLKERISKSSNLIIKRFSIKPRLPRIIGLNLTYACNLNCKMCGQYGTKGNYSRNKKLGELDFSLVEKLVLELNYKPLIYLWGGEPFLHSRILDIISLLKQKNLPIHINTNGTLLGEYSQELVRLKPDMITVSIDGPKEVHDKIRGKKVFDDVVKGVKKINSLKKRSDAPLLKCFCTITPDNLQAIEKMPSIVKNFSMFYISFIHPMFTTSLLGKKYQNILKEKFNVEGTSWKGFCNSIEKKIDPWDLSEKIKKIKREKVMFLRFSPDLSNEEIKIYYQNPGKFIKKSCSQAWSRADVMPNGDLVACSDFPDYVCGNIKNDSFKDIWYGEKYRKFRDFILKEDFPICSRCCKVFL